MPLLPLTQAAGRLGVNPETLRRRIKRGQIPTTRDEAGRYLVDVPVEDRVDESIQEPESSTQKPLQASIQALEAQVAALLGDKTWLQSSLEREQAASAELRILLQRALERQPMLELPALASPESTIPPESERPRRTGWRGWRIWG